MGEMQLQCKTLNPSLPIQRGTQRASPFLPPSNLLPMPPIDQTHQNPADMGVWDCRPLGLVPSPLPYKEGQRKGKEGCEGKQTREQHTTHVLLEPLGIKK